jgi:hypothetical protein
MAFSSLETKYYSSLYFHALFYFCGNYQLIHMPASDAPIFNFRRVGANEIVDVCSVGGGERCMVAVKLHFIIREIHH